MRFLLPLLLALQPNPSWAALIVPSGCSDGSLLRQLESGRLAAPSPGASSAYEGRIRSKQGLALSLPAGEFHFPNPTKKPVDLYTFAGPSRFSESSFWAALVNPEGCRILWARELSRSSASVKKAFR